MLKLKFQQKNSYHKDWYHQKYETNSYVWTSRSKCSRTNCTTLGCLGKSVIQEGNQELWEKVQEESSVGRAVAELRVPPLPHLG